MSTDDFSSDTQPPAHAGERAKSPGAGLSPGYRLDEYIIEKEIGSGGFGKTYLARDTNLDKKVAIKEYFPLEFACRNYDGSVSPSSSSASTLETYKWGLDSFIKEAQTLAKFEHPNIIRVIRYIKRNGTAYLVTEFADGPDLEGILNRRGKLSTDDVTRIILPLLGGLKKVHDAGILHRDIKPANIILRQDETPVLIDFGAARQAIGSRSKDLSVILSLGYAPYEQYFQSGNQGAWTDIYALGATAYHCLMGEPPQEGAARITDDQLPSLAASFPNDSNQSFLTALDWALRPAHEDRPQNLGEWADEIKRSGGGNDFRGGRNADVSVDQTPTIKVTGPVGAPLKDPDGQKPFPFALVAGGIGVLVAIIVVVFALQFPQKKIVATVMNDNAAVTEPDTDVAVVDNDPGPQKPPGPSSAEIAKDNADFNKARLIDSAEAYTLYLELHPQGVNVVEASNLRDIDINRRGKSSSASMSDPG